MSLAKRARVVERDIFGALIGALVGLVICRLAVFVIDIHPYALAAMMLVGAWSGVFLAHVGARRSLRAMESMRSFAASFRAICLRAILWLLGIASVLGVLAVLTGSFEVVGRVAATTAVTALAACCLWPFLILFDEEKRWRIGLFGTVSVITAYLLGMPSIWQIGYRPNEAALSGLTIALMTPVGLIAMYLSHSFATRVAGFFTLFLYAVTTTLFLFAIWGADGWSEAGKLAETGFILLGFGVLAVAATVNAATGDGRFWRWFGFAATGVASYMCIQNVWSGGGFDEETIVAVASIGVVIAHANLAMLASLRNSQVWWRYATIVAVATTAIALDAELLLDTGSSRGISMLGRIALASGILASTGTLALLILTRLNRPSEKVVVAEGPITQLEIVCPQCGKSKIVPLGTSGCDSCGLKLTIMIEQPQQ